MGNTESNVTSGVKKQAGVSTQSLYKLVNLKGGGLLVDMMKRACQSKQFAEIDHAIKTKVSLLRMTNVNEYINVFPYFLRLSHFSTIKVLDDIYPFRKSF